MAAHPFGQIAFIMPAGADFVKRRGSKRFLPSKTGKFFAAGRKKGKNRRISEK